jgi:hypothetical protein
VRQPLNIGSKVRGLLDCRPISSSRLAAEAGRPCFTRLRCTLSNAMAIGIAFLVHRRSVLNTCSHGFRPRSGRHRRIQSPSTMRLTPFTPLLLNRNFAASTISSVVASLPPVGGMHLCPISEKMVFHQHLEY